MRPTLPAGPFAQRQRQRPPSPAARRNTGASLFPASIASLADRLAEADEFYAVLQQTVSLPIRMRRAVQRAAFAGMLWSKQFYYFDIATWLKGDPMQPTPPPERTRGRNVDWQHLNNHDVISMPDSNT